jgi:hypothetical protein
MQGTDQYDKADASGQGKDKHKRSPVQPAFERQRVQQTSHGRTANVGDLEHRGSPGDGVHKVFGRYQVGQQRRACRATEGTPSPDQEQYGKDRPNSVQPAHGKNQQSQRTKYLQNVADQDHFAAVIAVGDMPGRQQE